MARISCKDSGRVPDMGGCTCLRRMTKEADVDTLAGFLIGSQPCDDEPYAL